MPIAPELELANRIFLAGVSATSAAMTWTPYLYADELNEEPELRNKVFAILIPALLDAIEEYESRFNGLKTDCQKLGLQIGPYYLSIIEGMLKLLAELLSLFNQSELWFISHFRHQILHGHLSEAHKEHQIVRSIRNGRVIREKLGREDRVQLSQPYRDHTVDETLERLRDRFVNTPTYYWYVCFAFGKGDIREMIYEDLRSNVTGSPAVHMTIPKPKFRPTDPGEEGLTCPRIFGPSIS